MKLAKLRSDLTITQQIQRGSVVYMVKDPLDGQYYKFGDLEFQILKLLDGTKNIAKILEGLKISEPDAELDAEDIKEFLGSINRMNLLEKSLTETNSMLVAKLLEERKNKLLSKKGSITYKRFPLFNPNRFFNIIHPYIKFLWKKPVVVCCLLFMLTSGCIILYHWKEVLEGIISVYSFHNKNVHSVIILWATILIIIAFHEFAHGLTCKHFGGNVPEIGFLLLFFNPCLYANVTDAYSFQNKKHKLYVVFAGGYIEFFIGSVFTYIWLFTYKDTAINAIAFQALTVCGLSSVLFNFNPLLKYDGYYALSDYLEIPNLKKDSASYTKAFVRAHIFRIGNMDEYEDYDKKTKRALLIYGLCCTIYMTMILTMVVFMFSGIILESLAEIGILVVALIIYKLFGSYIKRILGFIKEFFVMKNLGFSTGKGKITIIFIIAVVCSLLFLIPFPDNITSSSSLKALNKLNIHSSVQGILTKVNFKHNDLLHRGDILIELDNKNTKKMLFDREASLDSLKFQLKLAKSSGDAFNIEKLSYQIKIISSEVNRLKDEIKKLKVIVPQNSILLTENIDFDVGKLYTPGEVIAELLPLSKIYAEIKIDEADLSYVSNGTGLDLKLKAFPKLLFQGKILKILPKDFEKDTEKNFTAIAEFDNRDMKQLLFPGMTGIIKIGLPHTTGFGLIKKWLVKNLKIGIMFY